MAKGFEWLSYSRAAAGIVLIALGMLGTSVWLAFELERETSETLERHSVALIARPDEHDLEGLAAEEGIRAVERLSDDRSEVEERIEDGLERQVPDWFAGLFLREVPTEELQPGSDAAPLRLIADPEGELEALWPRWLGVMIGGGTLILLLLLLGSTPKPSNRKGRNNRLLADQVPETEETESSPLIQRQRELGVAAETDVHILEQLPEYMADAVLVFDVHGTIQYANPQAHALFEYHDEDLVGRSVSRLVPPWVNGNPAEAFTGIPPSQQQGAWVEHEARRLTRQGQLVDVSIACAPMDETGNNLKGQVCVVREIGDLRRKMASLELVNRGTDRFREGIAIVEAGGDFRIVYANDALAATLGTDSRSILGQALLPLVQKLDERVPDQLARAAESGDYGESWFEMSDGGDYCAYHMSLAPIAGDGERSRVTHIALIVSDFTELKQGYQDLESDQNLVRHVMAHNPLAICLTNADCEIVEANQAFEALFEAGTSSQLGALIPESTIEMVREALASVAEYRHYVQFRSSGEERVAELKVVRVEDKGRSLWFFNDVTERLSTARQLAAETERAKVTLGSIGDCVVTTNARGLIDYVNPVAEKLIGWKVDDAMGMPVDQVVRFFDEETAETIPSPLDRALRLGRTLRVERHALLRDSTGADHGVQLTASPIRDRNSEIIGGVLSFHDVTEMRRTARVLAYEARHDSLTGLFNKREFQVRLEDALESIRAEGSAHVLAFLDLDHFKPVNDTVGHAAGDELLKQLVERIRSNLRRTDVMARLGGDEFAVLFYGCSLDMARRICEQVVASVSEFHFEWGNETFRLGISIGLAPMTVDTANVDQLVEQADEACYESKNGGRNQVRVFSGASDHEAETDQWQSRLRRAVEEDGFLVFQQQADTFGSEGYREMLVRLASSEIDQALKPELFMPAARRHGYDGEIDKWVVSYVFAWLAIQEAFPDKVGINLGVATTASEDFADFVLQQARRTGVDPQRVVFELSEPDVMAHLSVVQDFIHRLNDEGFGFALQHFSASRSSFDCLKDLPLDYLKLDSSLTSDLEEWGEAGEIMLESVIRIGHVSGLRVIATRVEKPDLLHRLQQFDFDAIQGFAVSFPEPIESPPVTVH